MKFRAWNGEYFEFSVFNFRTGCLGCNFSTYVEIETPQLFTGLQDVNSVDIYEGDILHQLDPVMWNPFAVEYSDVAARFLAGGSLSQSVIISSELVVIGNIHENPELLNG